MLDETRMADLLAYCRIDSLDPTELPLMHTLYNAAISYMQQAGVSEPAEPGPRKSQFDLLVNALVLAAYDHRDMAAAAKENPFFRSTLVQLKLSEPAMPPVSDTGTGDSSGEDGANHG